MKLLELISVAFTLEYSLKGLNSGFCMMCSCLIHCYWDYCLLSTSRRWLSRLTYLCSDSLWEQWMLSSCLDSCLEGETSYWTHTTSFCGPARNSVPSATNLSPEARDGLTCSRAELGLTFCHLHCCHFHFLLQNQLHPLTGDTGVQMWPLRVLFQDKDVLTSSSIQNHPVCLSTLLPAMAPLTSINTWQEEVLLAHVSW